MHCLWSHLACCVRLPPFACAPDTVAWLLDLDGVVWLAGVPIPGSVEAITRLRESGERVVFVSNNSSVTMAEQEAKLESIGVPARGDVLTSAAAAAGLLEPGTRALVCAGPGVVEALEHRGVTPVREPPAEAVIVGFHLDFDYSRLRAAHAAVAAGARLIGTNDDATYPTPLGEIPGGGAILSAVAYAASVTPTVAGKPFQPMADAVRALVGDGPHLMVGDRPSTDGRFARNLGARFALVLSGVTKPEELPVEPIPDLLGPNLGSILEAAGR
jgi:HAD superfamily hydrolase (TIGR01450 family)